MSFTASGAGLAFAAIGILVGFLAVAGLAYESGVDDHPGRIIIRDVCALYVIANVVVYSMTALPPRSESETRAATIAEISSHFGLESGKEYPLQLGERFAGTSGDMRVVGALFYTYGSGSWNPATGLSIGFSAEDGRSYILEIPTAKVTFVQSETAEPSVKLDMGGGIWSNERDARVLIHREMSSCSVVIDAGWWTCHRDTLSETKNYEVSDDLDRQGLAPVVASAFGRHGSDASAIVTLSPQAYNDLPNSR
ncbi:hypothetical protein SEML1_0229 [Candidatus Southlakia epibionticum]|uniref:Uncharacterized protein n=1 Tax=Candidatus Southlakia epibionticum TaxID=3043284 RepID=A0ABY8WY97_9BACT|nr:hypothetical protein SEML1_0229 [Candidatus Saccharimonadaceae bacterium ML1]